MVSTVQCTYNRARVEPQQLRVSSITTYVDDLFLQVPVNILPSRRPSQPPLLVSLPKSFSMRATTTALASLGLAVTSHALANPAQLPAITPAPAPPAVVARQADPSRTSPECYESYRKLRYDLYSPALQPTMADDLSSYLEPSGGYWRSPATQLVCRLEGDAAEADRSRLWSEKVSHCSYAVETITRPASISAAYASLYSTWRVHV
jgi:hypothetical protein